MKSSLLFKLCLLWLVFGFAACRETNGDAARQPTFVYLMRHAEKDVSDPKNEDPALTPQGADRAEALRAALENEPVAALYTTKYIRNKDTLKPLATGRQVETIVYEAHDFDGLKKQILEHHQGETVVVAGHSNTLLPIIKAFGATVAIDSISEQQYDYLFKLAVMPDGTSTVETQHYGAESR